MATLSSTGIGSGLDVKNIVTQLMALERQPVTRLQTQQTTIGGQITALGKIKSVIDALNTAATALTKPENLSSFTSALADSSIAKITTGAQASAGNYNLEVTQLASNHKLVTTAPLNPSAGGKLTIQTGTDKSPATIELGSGSTLSDLRDAINSANAGVSATIVNGEQGSQLILTSLNSGAANQIKLTGEGALAGLTFDPTAATQATGSIMKQQEAGQDAKLIVDGIAVSSASNSVTNALSGVTLELNKTNIGTPSKLTITNDASVMQSKMEAFVKAYNDVISTMKDLTKFNQTDKTKSGTLNGDTTVRDAQAQLRSVLSNLPEGVDNSLRTFASVGVISKSDGTLEFKSDVFKSAAASNFSGLTKTVAAYGNAFSAAASNLNKTNGLVGNRIAGLTTTSKNMGNSIDSMQARMSVIEARYYAQYSALDSIMTKFQGTQASLTSGLKSIGYSSGGK